jgi:hypothetical protein
VLHFVCVWFFFSFSGVTSGVGMGAILNCKDNPHTPA